MLRALLLSSMFACLVQPAAAAPGPLFFAPSYNLGTPDTPLQTVLVDLNHDGIDDAVVSHPTGGFSVAFAIGGGSFGPFARAFTSHPASSMFVLDVDGDGRLDVAVAGNVSGGPESIVVAYGDGNGTWVDSAVVVVSPGEGWIGAAADLDGDNRGDLAFALVDSDSVVVFRGNANRTLARVSEASLPARPAAMAIGDLAGSAAPDLLVSYEGVNSYSVLPNEGGGVLGTRADFPVGTPISNLRLAALDASPGLDMLAVASGLQSWTGAGSGAFSLVQSLDQGSAVVGLQVRDLDHDGIPDVVGA